MKLTINIDLAAVKEALDMEVPDDVKTGGPETLESLADYANDHMDELVEAAEMQLVELLAEYHRN